MSRDLDQNIDPEAIVAIPDEKSDGLSPLLPVESAYVEYASSPGFEQQYPPSSYLHYPYPPPAYFYQDHTPPGDQSFPMYGYPLPLSTAMKQLPKQYLRILTRPAVATFAQEKQKAAWNIILVQLAFLAIIGAISSYAAYAFIIPMYFSLLNISNIGIIDITNTYKNQALQGGLQGLISIPISVLMQASIVYFLAKAFKGRGTYIEQIYCSLLFLMPTQIILGLLNFIPLVGFLGIIPAFVYGSFVLIRMNMAVHGLSAKKASLVVLIIPAGVIALILCGVALVFLILVPLIFLGR